MGYTLHLTLSLIVSSLLIILTDSSDQSTVGVVVNYLFGSTVKTPKRQRTPPLNDNDSIKYVSDASDQSIVGVVGNYLLDAAIKKEKRERIPPLNNNDSLKYILYTPSNRNEPCVIQPNVKQFNKCSFRKSYETKLLIHGSIVFLSENNLFNVLKDAILEHGNYNVILVDWTLYNGLPFQSVYSFAEPVGKKVAEMINFIQMHTNVSLKTFHCIGHSVGSHICGVAGRDVHTLGRITGLDPEGVSALMALTPNIRLNYTDADFVDVMHTSDAFSVLGLGYLDPVGHLDFYMNSGVEQPRCFNGNNYTFFEGNLIKVQTTLDKIICNHLISIEYFTQSLKNGCKFVGTQCQSYLDFKNGRCLSGVNAEIGFNTKKIAGIPPMTKFYLTTLAFPPYCYGYWPV